MARWWWWKRSKFAETLAEEEKHPVGATPWDRLAVMALLYLASALILAQALFDETKLPRLGQVAEEDVMAPRGFVYRNHLAAQDLVRKKLEEQPAPMVFSPAPLAAAAATLRAEIAAVFPDSVPGGRQRRDRALRAVEPLLRDAGQIGLLAQSLPQTRQLLVRREDGEQLMTAGAALQPGNWSRYLGGLPLADALKVGALLDHYLPPTLRRDEARAESLAAEISRRTPAPEQRFTAEAPVIRTGQEITERDLDLLTQLQDERRQGFWRSLLALLVFLALMFAFGIIYLQRYLSVSFRRFRDLVAISFAWGMVLLICLVLSLAIMHVEIIGFRFTSAVLPTAAAAMVLALCYSTRLAFILTLFLSILIATVITPRLALLVMFCFGGLTASLTSARARKRSDLFRAGVWVAAVQALVILAVSALLGDTLSIALCLDIASAVASGLLAALLAPIILLPVEAISRRTSNFRLLELSDLNHPLLQMLLRKAPGTFQHSQHVALLAQTAAEAIGANSLLARVGAYFHDIGKIRKAEYFTENQAEEENPHDRLKPSLSASIVRSHVADGRSLAEEYALPEIVADFISQHHGTAIMNVFYHRALEETGEGETVERNEYQYPGPKPQIQEIAIVMLADAVEAATRTLEKPTTQRLEKIVRKVVTEKFENGELNECDLTLRDLNTIAESFIHVLTGMYHTRNVDYPDTDEIAEAEAERREKEER